VEREEATMQLVDVSEAPNYDVGKIRDGELDSKHLLHGVDGSPNNYRVALTTATTPWPAPRHRHNFDQIRFPINGAFEYTKGTTLPAGWVGYFPEGAYYGPQLRQPGLQMLVIQFGGAGGCGYLGEEELREARGALTARGAFVEGVFSWLDEKGKKHNKDGFEACWEESMGRKLEYPAPRYDGQIKMNPANFEWIEDATYQGVAHKWLGTFTERNIRMGFSRLSIGANLAVGDHDAPEFLFLAKGSVAINDKRYGLHSAFGFEANEGPIIVEGFENSELLRVQLPRF
jgi:hypothetical protein